MTLDRSEMWDSYPVNGTKGCYEFCAMPDDDVNSITKRFLPCPCEFCVMGNIDACVNLDIVATVTTHDMPYRVVPDAEEFLTEPIESYTVAALLAFIKLHKKKRPKDQRKPDLIAFIKAGDLREFVITPDDLA